MITRYSTCHFAEVMFIRLTVKEMPVKVVETFKCSFCGEVCELVPEPFTVKEDIELTLRRWKDGDCSLEDMFERLNTEYRRAWNEVFDIASEELQAGKRPKYQRDQNMLTWSEVEQ